MFDNHGKDFLLTIERYKKYLSDLLQGYKFINYSEIDRVAEPTVIWRHDIDVSVHQAHVLAQIENDFGIKATYFVMLSNWFYDIRDPEIYSLLKAIEALGHTIGLHFDFEYLPSGTASCLATFEKALKQQKEELENILETPITVFSFHNPSALNPTLLSDLTDFTYANMINVYGDKIVKAYKYCSDSNGLWYHERLDDLIDPVKFPRLHVLTHPEWWTESLMTPRQKIEHALMGRVRAILKRHDEALRLNKRPNF